MSGQRRSAALAAVLLVALVASVPSPSSSAAGPVWTSSGPSSGGNALELAIDPTDPSTIYDGAGGVGVYKSTDSGSTWAAASSGLPLPLTIESLAVDPSAPSTLYAGTSLFGQTKGLWKSADGGGRWHRSDDGLPPGGVVHAVTIDSSTATVYAGTDGGVYRTTDGGASWQYRGTGIPAGALSYEVAVDPADPLTLYTAVFDVVGTSVYKTVDGGAAWHDTGLPPAAYVPTGLAVDPADPERVFVSTDGTGTFVSLDGADTWNEVAGLAGLDVVALSIDPLTHTTLYAGTNPGLFKSTDGGASWRSASFGIRDQAEVVSFAFDPGDPSRVFAGTCCEVGGVYRSLNAGRRWAPQTFGFPPDTFQFALAQDPLSPQTIYTAGGAYARVFRSLDGGVHWTGADDGIPHAQVGWLDALVMDPSDAQTLYAGFYLTGLSGTTVFRTDDGARHWKATALADASVYALAIDPLHPRIVYAASADRSVYKTTDGGHSWAKLDIGSSGPVYTVAVDPADPRTVYAGSYGGVHKSTDAGATWTLMNSGLRNTWVTVIRVDPSSPQTVYAGTGGAAPGGVFKSIDGGQRWSLTSLHTGWIFSMTIDPANLQTLYAGVNQHGLRGVYGSTDGGTTWTLMNDGLGNQQVNALVADPSGTMLHAATFQGVWSLIVP